MPRLAQLCQAETPQFSARSEHSSDLAPAVAEQAAVSPRRDDGRRPTPDSEQSLIVRRTDRVGVG